MIIEIRLAENPLRRWHLELIDRLTSSPDVEVTLAQPPRRDDWRKYPRDIERVLTFERMLHHLPPGLGSLIGPTPEDRLPISHGATPGVKLDLSATPTRDQRTWWVEYDGQPGEQAALQALRRNSPPWVSVRRPDGTIAAVGRPGSEMPGIVAAAFDDMLAGCITLILKALRSDELISPTNVSSPEHAVPSLRRHVAKQSLGAVAHRGYRALYRAPHWRVGWRFTDGPGLIDAPDTLPDDWKILADDGRRFYADPFPFIHRGKQFLFVEDYEHRLGRGVISVVEFDDTGPMYTPEPVLEHRVHLSYPFVLEDDGQVWMIPETSAAGSIELYRADPFPGRWTLDATLVEGLEASDATVFRREDRWWMMATVRAGGSFSDALHIWFADRLRGPWTAHPRNPVLVDIASARPAGRLEERDGVLRRPVQDCRTGYGAALGIAQVSQLDGERYDQRIIGRLAPGPWWPGRRLHTLNRAGRLECIDGSAMAPRLWRKRRQRTV